MISKSSSDEVERRRAFEKKPENKVTVSDYLDNLAPLVEKTEKSIRHAMKNEHGLVRPKARNTLDICVSPENVARALKIMNALLKALKSRGFFVQISGQRVSHTIVSVLDESFPFRIQEKLSQIPHVLTPEEKATRKRYPNSYAPAFDYIPTGKLLLKLDLDFYTSIRRNWMDGKRQRIEDILNDFIVGLVIAAETKKAWRVEQERRRQEWEEAAKKRRELERNRWEEKERIRALEDEASRWEKAEKIRKYIYTVEKMKSDKDGSSRPESEFENWISWAREIADRVDPLKDNPPSILDDAL